ncbi:NUDIX hydrolase [Acrocarpospora catenulata]|uniref:NUDIX hydrolase n=1 Tax=Acrocarpospora catenulata TaxID=2836182 RepID=UPI001BDAE6FF|nr:NUDIX hydrolase [Acrocarpospora catenulata]
MNDQSTPGLSTAATCVLIRDRDGRLEVLLLRRNSAGSFPGAWVFPGGQVDPADAGPADDQQTVARRAASRETAEEAGLLVAADAMVPFSHWTAPEQAPRRFRTWVFVAPAPSADVVVDGRELLDHRWLSPEEALREHGDGRLTLLPPTWLTLYDLRQDGSVAEAMGRLSIREPESFAGRVIREDTGMAMVWAGDDEYDADRPRTGRRHRLLMGTLPWQYVRTASPPR